MRTTQRLDCFLSLSTVSYLYLRSRIETKSTTARLFPTNDRTFVISQWMKRPLLNPVSIGEKFIPNHSSAGSVWIFPPLSTLPRNPENREKCFKFAAIWSIVLIRKFPSSFLSVGLRSGWWGNENEWGKEGNRGGEGYRSADTPSIARD